MKGYPWKMIFMSLCLFMSCGTMNDVSRSAESTLSTPLDNYQIPIYAHYLPENTTNKITRQDSSKIKLDQLKRFLREQYQVNYDENISPQLAKLAAIIQDQTHTLNAQASSNLQLSMYLKETRHRTDSIRKNERHYRDEILKIEKSTAKTLLDRDSKFKEDTQKQINDNTIRTKMLFAGFLALLFLVGGLYAVCRTLSKKVDRILSQLPTHV